MRATVLLGLALLAGCARENRQPPKPATPVTVAMIEQITPQVRDRYSASILADRQVALAFRVSGFVESIYQARGPGGRPRNLEIGDFVPAGAVLARIRSKDYELQVAQASGQLAEARESEQSANAQLAQAEAAAAKGAQDFERARFLLEKSSLTRPDYDAAKAQHDATRAQVEAARAQVQAVAARIRAAEAAVGTATLAREDTSLIAPFAGAVVQRNIEPGGLATPGQPAIVLADLSVVKVAFGVPDLVAVTLKPGIARAVYFEALPGRQFAGTVSAIAAVADTATRLFQVNLEIRNPDRLLRPGMIASLSLAPNGPSQAVPVVPLSSIIRGQPDGSGFAVMIVEGGRARRRAVTLGPAYGDRIAIHGLEPGDQVVNRGASTLTEGEAVEVIH